LEKYAVQTLALGAGALHWWGMALSRATTALKAKLGKAVTTDAEELYPASMDGSKLSFPYEALVRPRDEKQVGHTLELANKFKVPVTTRGAGSSLTGSASPHKGGWVLDLSGWNRIRIDKQAGMAYVQPGATVAAIQDAAEKQGWRYPPDPSSKKYCSIGGTIACNAGGMTGGKYGVTRDYVFGLEGFLPTGEFVRWGGDVRKYVSGYNIKDLWIGSEGTLGVITSTVLRLVPAPECKWTLLTAFKNEAQALRAVKALLVERIVPSILEFLDRLSVTCAERGTGKPIFDEQPGSSVLLLELDGTEGEVASDRKRVIEWAETYGIAYSETYDREKAEGLWEVRRKSSPNMFEMGNSKINEDIVVPLRSQLKLIRFVQRLSKETGLAIPTFGHAADGNFHVNIMFNREDRQQARKAKQAVIALMKEVVELGGAITGEHGIGLAKTPFMKIQHNRAELAVMQAIKKAMDPKNILNPGKLFEPFEVWAKTPEKVKQPWDHR